ncbi:hypothetical protein CPLU01_14596 [Colletotrichum plurivorum]|uniref:Zn(2)-C6 fungal-type domain-containing protein n=1 Tax=Colletotrichum plurivorum TaxID=2175906 RepID=A0A8H6JJD6_9PEZI|nr:hypothetical protein CPLU01_14596 [Colletotrichum plurivorum]
MSSVTSGGEVLNSGEPAESPRESAKARPQACERCWKRKQKCDRRLPACSSCQGLRVACIPRNQDFNALTELSHTYVESLKKRVGDLERDAQASSRKRLRTNSYRAESLDHCSSTSPPIAPPQLAASVSPSTSGQATKDGHEDSSVRATMGAIGFLSRSAMAEPGDHSDDLPKKFSLAEMISGALAIDGRDPSAACPAPSAPMIDSPVMSITRDSTGDYIKQFLDQAVFLPYLDKMSLLGQYEAVLINSQPHSSGSPSPMHIFNIYMALGIGLLISPGSSHLSMLSSGFRGFAVKQLPAIIRSEPPQEHIHCMIMLLLYSLYNSVGGSAWHLLGLTVKSCISLGLHREPDVHAALTTVEGNKRRWLFWTVYTLDRLAMDRPFSIQDDDISVRIPPEEDGSLVPTTTHDSSKKLSMSRYIIHHAQLVSSIRTRNQTDILLDYSNICHWRDLPPSLDRSPVPSFVELLEQLTCRALALLISPNHPTASDIGLLLGTVHDVELDVLSSSRQFVSRSYDRFIQGEFIGSFIEAYDIFQAAVICVCLTRRMNVAERNITKVAETISKASTLVTVISSKFPALAAFQRVLMSLSTRMMDDRNTSDGVSFLLHSELPFLLLVNIAFKNQLWEALLPIIPRRIQQFIRYTFI